MAPLGTGGRGDLGDAHLAAVGEGAKLRPQEAEGLGPVRRPAVVDPENARFAQRRVEDVEATLAFAQVRERGVALAVAHVPQHRVPVAEGSAPAVLTGETDGGALIEQRGEGEVLADAPVERLAPVALCELAPAF